MKKIRFTLLGVAFTAMLAVGVNAQDRGHRGGERGSSSREVSRSQGNGRSEMARTENRTSRIEGNRTERSDRGNSRNESWKSSSTRTNREESTRINRDNTAVVGSRPSSNRDYDNGRHNRENSQGDQGNRSESLKNRDFHKNPVRISSSSSSYRGNRPVSNVNVRNYHKYSYNSYNFYGNNGIYYRPYNSGYVRYMPYVGFRINVLPVGYVTINIGNRNPYYFYEGVYYRPNRSYYEVIEAPIGAIVYALPAGYERVNYDGEYLYEFGGVLYQKIYYRGSRAYQVVGYLD